MIKGINAQVRIWSLGGIRYRYIAQNYISHLDFRCYTLYMYIYMHKKLANGSFNVPYLDVERVAVILKI